MRKLLLGILFLACWVPTTMLHAAPISEAGIAAQEVVMTKLAKLERNNNGKYIRSSKLQALTLIKETIEKYPELAASLTSFVISQGVGVTATVTTACQAAAKSDQASAIVAAAIKAAPPALAAAAVSAAISVSPKQASAITTAAINAVLKQAPAITSAAVSAAPLQAAIITQAALKAAGSTEIRRLIAVAASNAGVSEQVINKVLQDVTNKNGSYEIFKKDADDAVSSTITKGSSSESNNSPLGVAVPIGSTGATGSTGGGGVIACVKNGVTASCS